MIFNYQAVLKHASAILISLFFIQNAKAQNRIVKCRDNYTETIANGAFNYKTSISRYVIPVVIHVILDSKQFNKLKGEEGIFRRIQTQLDRINEDFAAANSDINNVPEIFKHLIGTTNIQFALAKIDPNGNYTKGYEIRLSTSSGVNEENGYGSGTAFSNAKYYVSGGLDIWDPTSYLNIWVINPLSDLGGITISNDVSKKYQLPENEIGIVINYGAFGERMTSDDFFILNYDKGRTLTHELGHFLGLNHIWGNDDRCPDNGGIDDGINDTPSQSGPSTGCPNYPKVDRCTNDKDGILFFNYMDYTNDRCQFMFTKQQCSLMENKMEFSVALNSLTLHPHLLDSNMQFQKKNFVVYPNPAHNILNISFQGIPENLIEIRIVNMLGQVVYSETNTIRKAFYSYELTNIESGVYLISVKNGYEQQAIRISKY